MMSVTTRDEAKTNAGQLRMSNKLLFVSDDLDVLKGYQRGLRRQFNVDVANGSADAVAMIATHGPYGVIVADMRLSGMHGVELLREVKQCAPDAVRILVAEKSHAQAAIDAVNEHDIFRVLNHPSTPQTLVKVLLAGLEQHRLVTAEKELLQNTLRGSVQVLSEVLAIASPEAFGRTTRITRYMQELANAMELPDPWRMETLALLSQIGCVILPDTLLKKVSAGRPLNDDELAQFSEHPIVGAELLAKIPRLEEVAESIKYQAKHFDGSGMPADSKTGEAIPLGARMLKVILDFDACRVSGLTSERALAQMEQKSRYYDPQVMDALVRSCGRPADMVTRELSVARLMDGMFLAADVETRDGIMLVCQGQETTRSVREHLVKFWRNDVISETVSVSVPATVDEGAFDS